MTASSEETSNADATVGQQKKKTLFICVGDHSADLHAARVIKRLQEKSPGIDIWGVGGVNMVAAGARILHDSAAITTIGIIEVIRFLPKLYAVRTDLTNRIIADKPDALLLMDFGGFNVGFATHIRSKLKDIPIIYFISPQVWGSRPWRINAIAAAVNKMLVIFPFEEGLYRNKGINARFVGNPITGKFKPVEERGTKDEFCARHGLDASRPIVGIFPGSRKQEITYHSEALLLAIDWLRKERPEIQFIVSRANQVVGDIFQNEIERLGYIKLLGANLKIIESEHNEELMTHADLLWAKSGTTTLEATLIGKPMIIYYSGSWTTYMLFLIFKTVRYVGWPNLLNGEGLVPELLMLDCRAEQLVKYTVDWLDVPGLRKEIGSKLLVLKGHLGDGDFTDNAADEILQTLGP